MIQITEEKKQEIQLTLEYIKEAIAIKIGHNASFSGKTIDSVIEDYEEALQNMAVIQKALIIKAIAESVK